MTTALEGLRVLELGSGIASAVPGMFLAENGAEVIKVEPPSGDPSRGSPAFIVWHRGKKSVVLDLKAADDVQLFKQLVQTADGLIENLRPGLPEKLGIDYDSLTIANPNLVYAEITGWGKRGPYRDLPGYEEIVAAKTGRMASQMGFRSGPIFTPTPIESYGAAALATQGLLAALLARKQTGCGQKVHTSLMHALIAYDMGGFMFRAGQQSSTGKANGTMLAFLTPECADGRYIQMCSRQPHLFRNWMSAIGLENLYDDPELQQMPDVFPSAERLDEVRGMIEEKMREKAMDEWLDLFTKSDVGGDPFLKAQEFLDAEQTIANGRRAVVVDPTVGETVQVGPLGNFSDTPSVIGVPAPSLGQHTKAILGSLNSSVKPAEVSSLSPKKKLRYPLEGITVIDAAFFYAAPFAATLLGQMGARIIKIEPPTGDPTRRNWKGIYTKGMSGKESVVLDLKKPEGLQALYNLVPRADIFLHNFRPGTPERLKIDYGTLSEINPRLLYIYGSCYGSNGPWKSRAGFHSTPNALAGSGVLESGCDNPPRDRSFPDPVGALSAATAAMIGLHARERTGKGQYLETTMINSLGYVVAPWGLQYRGKPEDPLPDQGQHGYHALHQLYEAKDSWLFLMAPKEEQWRNLAKILGLGALLGDARFATPDERMNNDAELSRAIEDALKEKSADEWERTLLAADVPAVRADGTNHADFMLNSQHVRDNGIAIEDEIPGVGKFWRSANCVEFSDMDPRAESPSPMGGATRDILRELGYSQAQVDELEAKEVTKVIGHGLD